MLCKDGDGLLPLFIGLDNIIIMRIDKFKNGERPALLFVRVMVGG